MYIASVKGLQTNNVTLSAILVSRDQHNNFVSIIVPLQGSRVDGGERGDKNISREKARRA